MNAQYAKQDDLSKWTNAKVGEGRHVGVRPVGSAYGEKIDSPNWVVWVMGDDNYCEWSKIVAAGGQVDWAPAGSCGGLTDEQAKRAQEYFLSRCQSVTA